MRVETQEGCCGRKREAEKEGGRGEDAEEGRENSSWRLSDLGVSIHFTTSVGGSCEWPLELFSIPNPPVRVQPWINLDFGARV